MKEFDKMRFYTTAEIADKLSMNIQVVTRKLQSGEIEGYKIGKDWRVEEDCLQKWLLKLTNRNQLSPRDKVIGNYFKDNRLTHLPAQRKKRLYVLQFFLEKFESNRNYSEAEINETIKLYFDDFCTVRREFIMEKMMFRSGGFYRRNTGYRTIE